MQDYINLINFLKENDESVRKDLEELRFWCKWFTLIWWNPVFLSHRILWIWTSEYNPEWKYSNNDTIEIIWNNLDYHHIMMYLFKKWYNCDFQNNNLIHIEKVWIDEINIETNKEILYWLIAYNSFKPLHEQKSEVYKQLLDYFISIK